MSRKVFTVIIASAALILASASAYAGPLRFELGFAYGSTTSTFGLQLNPNYNPYFDVPTQINDANDGIITGGLEFIAARSGPLELGLAAKGAFALSSWYLGATTVYDSQGNPFYLDGIHVNTDWWALAAMGTAHLHLGRFATLDGALGYGPYGYLGVSYYDDYGIVTGPVSGLFPSNAWSLDWTVGISFRFFWYASLFVNAGMMGPDFIAGTGLSFPI